MVMDLSKFYALKATVARAISQAESKFTEVSAGINKKEWVLNDLLPKLESYLHGDALIIARDILPALIDLTVDEFNAHFANLIPGGADAAHK